jgi:hypothetical protein
MSLTVEIGDKSLAAIQGLGEFLKKCKEAMEDGFQPGGDIPVIATSALVDLLPTISSISAIKEELDLNPDSRAILAALLVNDMIEIFS